MTREEATIQSLLGHIEAIEQEPCEDVVNREAVIDEIEFYQINPQHFDFDSLINDIKDLPSVTPTRKKGKWIYNEKDSDLDYLVYSCSVCGRHVHIYLTNNNRCIEDYPYCHCGAYMKGEKE